MTKQKLSIFVKFSIFTALFFLFAIESQAQSISIFDIDTSSFPIMKAKIYAFDKDGKQQRPSASELKLSENGIDRKILSVTCPNPKPVKAISSVLVMDVSGSMASGGSSGIANIDLAKQASTSWINALPTASSQCAITSFDGSNYFIQDFTTDRSKLLSAINILVPKGGTDYDAALYNPMAGGIPIAKMGKYKKVLVILSDGMPNQEPQVQTIINEANSNGIMIFAVTLGMPCPDNLKEITTKTGGFWYENVTSVDNARQIYFTIMNNTNNSEPCEITWESEKECKKINVFTDIEFSFNQDKSNARYETPLSAIVNLLISPDFITFGKRIPSTQNDTIITISAQNSDLTINSITRKFGSPDFTIKNATFPLVIPKNSSIKISISFSPNDSVLKYASFEIESDKCLTYFSVNGGFPKLKLNYNTLKLSNPNGGETFVVGSDTIISWTGISPSDTVSLYYSNNKGNNWQVLTNSTANLQYNWTKIKPPSSNECLIRVKQSGTNKIIDTIPVLSIKGHSNYINCFSYSPDGKFIVTGSSDNTAKIWDTNTGTLIRTLSGHIYSINGISYSPDGKYIVTGSLDDTVKIWDANTGTLIRTFKGHLFGIYDISYSPDGSRIATTSSDNTAKIWDANTGDLIRTFTGLKNNHYFIKYSPDGNQIALPEGDSTVQIWDVNTGKLIRTLFGHYSTVYAIAFSPDGSKIATGGSDKRIIIWDTYSGNIINTLKGHAASIYDIAYSPDGNLIASASGDRTAIIWDVNSGTQIRTLVGHVDQVPDISFNYDGTRIATANSDLSLKIWNIEDLAPLQEDQSDAVFSIVAPEVQSKDIDMKKCLVASSKDSVITNFIENIGSYKCRIDSIYFRGTDASAFSLVSGFPQYTIGATKKHNVEIRFKPTRVGIHNAEIVIITQADTLFQKITGEGVQLSLAIINKYIDFGKVYVGDKKDTLQAMTIKNNGISPINISDVKFLAPNDKDFSMISGSKSFTLGVGDTAKMDLRFSANSVGHQSSFISFEYNNGASSSQVQLYAEGINHGPKIQSEILGITDLKCEDSKLDSIKIINQGDIDLKLDDATLSGVNSDEFELIDNVTGITIPSNKDYFLKYLFKPKSDGNKIAELNIKSNSSEDSDLYLQLEANAIKKYELTTNSKLVINGNIGEIATGTVLLENKNDVDITISDTNKIDPFYFDNLTLPFVVKSNESLPITIKYNVINNSKINKNLEFTSEPCKVKSNISLNYGSSSPKAKLYTGTYQAYPGDIINIPIMLKDTVDLDASNSKNLTVDLTFNATLLEPIGDTPIGSLSSDNKFRTITLELPTTADANGILKKFKFKVGLGNDSTTKLDLKNQISDSNDVELTAEPGDFHLLGICRAAGPRLINPNGEVKLSLIRPNPVGDNGELDIETIENGQTELYIVNLKGEKVATLYQGELAAGKQTLIISTKDLSNGTYFVILQTPTVTQKVKMEVVK